MREASLYVAKIASGQFCREKRLNIDTAEKINSEFVLRPDFTVFTIESNVRKGLRKHKNKAERGGKTACR